MEVNIETIGEATKVKVSGRIDTTTAADFQAAIAPLMKLEKADIEVDCSDLEYTSSQGLRSFLMLQKCVTMNQGKMALTGMKANVKEIFDITGFSSIITIL